MEKKPTLPKQNVVAFQSVYKTKAMGASEVLIKKTTQNTSKQKNV
jgi:hypothetical protein